MFWAQPGRASSCLRRRQAAWEFSSLRQKGQVAQSRTSEVTLWPSPSFGSLYCGTSAPTRQKKKTKERPLTIQKNVTQKSCWKHFPCSKRCEFHQQQTQGCTFFSSFFYEWGSLYNSKWVSPNHPMVEHEALVSQAESPAKTFFFSNRPLSFPASDDLAAAARNCTVTLVTVILHFGTNKSDCSKLC